MFRPIRRKERALSQEDSKALLRTVRRGVLAMNWEDGYPYAIPINFFYDENAQKIYFHGAKVGQKIEAIKASNKVCFTAYGDEEIKKEAWAPFVKSVVLFGRCNLIEDASEAMTKLKIMAEKYYPDESTINKGITRSGKATQMFEIEIEYLTGKEVQEK